MPLKSLFTMAVILLFSLAAAGQKASISGHITDATNNENVPFASIAVIGHEGPSGGTVSGPDGRFRIENLDFSTYKLVVSFIGLQQDTLENIVLSRQNPVANLGTIRLSPQAFGIDEVEVTANANTVATHIDRKVYRTEDFGTASGGNASDILNKLPSVSVDPDGTVSLRGTSDLLVYLNGKPTLMEPSVLLGQLSAENIQNIEIITVPGARYDAQGKGGIININTKKAGLQGFSLTTNGLLGGGPWNHTTDAYSGYNMNDNRSGAGLNISYGLDNISFYGGLQFSERNINGKRTGDARLLQDDGSYYHMVADGERPEWFRNFTTNAGFEWKTGEMSNLSASYFYGKREEGRSAYYVYHNFFGDKDKNPIPAVPVAENWVYNPNTDNRTGTFHAANLDYSYRPNENTSFAVSVLYEHSGLDRALDNRDYAFDEVLDAAGALQEHFRQTDNTPLDGIRFSADYSRKLSNGHQLGIGIQPQWLNISGGFSYDTLGIASGTWGSYGELENAIDLTRVIVAGYVDYQGTLGELKYMAGLRLEQLSRELEIANPDYFTLFERDPESTYLVNKLDVFPSVHADYPVSEKTRLVFAASRRTSRPAAKDLAPFLYRRHYEVYVVGDPALKAEYLTTAELTLSRKFGKQQLGLTGFYRGTDNAVFRVNTVFEEQNVLIRSITNAGNTSALGLELNSNLEAGTRVKFFLGGSLYRYHVEGNIFGYRENNTSTNWGLKGNMNYSLSKSLRFILDFNVRSATVTSQGENYLFWTTNASLGYKPAKWKAWDFTLKGIDLLATNLEGLNTRAFDSLSRQIFYQETEYLRAGPIVELTAGYSLNANGKTRKRAENTFGKEQF
jgi:outer membrane receptor protein involved in Fe transport